MVPIALIGSAYTLRHQGHVRVDIFYEGFGTRTRALVDLFSAMGLLVVAVLVAWLSLNFVLQAYHRRRLAGSGRASLPLCPEGHDPARVQPLGVAGLGARHPRREAREIGRAHV